MAEKRSIGFWIALGCGVAFVGFIAFIAIILVVVFGAMRSSAPYREAVARAQNDPRVIELLGKPVTTGYFVSGSVKTQNRHGNAALNIPLRGPKGKATLGVQAIKRRGRWTFIELIVTPPAGPEIDLLSGESPRTAAPVS